MSLRFLAISTLLASFWLLNSCHDNSEDQPPPGNGDGVPAGMTRLYGTVRDQNDQFVSAAALHVYYDAGTTAPVQGVTTPSQTTFSYAGTPLTTECHGSTPIPDGVVIKIFWDVDSDGPDNSDPQPPLCDDPPNCDSGPSFTVNLNQFTFNGTVQFGAAGTFYMAYQFITIGDVLTPNRFYLRVFCADGNILWQTDPIDVPAGPSQIEVTFQECTACNGIPVNPEWALEQSFPNPAVDSASIRYGLHDAATALLMLRELSSGHSDTLVNEHREPGSYVYPLDLQARANGLYEYEFRAGTYSADGTLLKNAREIPELEAMAPIAQTQTGGNYRFDTAAGVNVNLRSESNQNQGLAFLDHVHLVVIQPGYATLDTNLAITSAESLQVDLTLRAP